MVDKAHSLVVEGSRHAAHNLTYPDATNRAAGTNEGKSIVVATANLYQYAKQDDDDSVWMLTGIGPPLTWLRVTSTGGGDFYGPVSATDNAIVIFNTTTGKLCKNSVAKVLDVANEHIVQLEDPNAAGTFLDAVKAKYTAPNGTPGGTQIVLGSASKTTVLESSGNHYANTSGKKILTEAMTAVWELAQRGAIVHGGNDTSYALRMENTGLNPGNFRIYGPGNRTPEGNVTAVQGSVYVRVNGDSSNIYFKTTGTGNTGWASLL